MPGESGVTVVTMLVCFFIFACEAAGASSARHSLRPLMFQTRKSTGKTRAVRGEIAEVCAITIAVIASGAKQSIFDLAMPSHGLLRSARNDGSGAKRSLRMRGLSERAHPMSPPPRPPLRCGRPSPLKGEG